MSYALLTLWHDRARYAPGVLAVAFSAILIALQCGLLIGIFKISSTPIDHASSDPDSTVWVGSAAAPSVDLGRPIPTSYLSRVAGRPGVHMPEGYIAAFANLSKPAGGTELCFLLGTLLDDDSAAAARVLTPELRAALTEPDAIVCDEADAARLRLVDGGRAKINGREVRLVGTVRGVKGISGAWVFCSLYTARHLLGLLLPPDHVTYLLARCDSPARAREVARELREQYGADMSASTAGEFSTGSRVYWLLRTKAGIALGFSALLGLVVGAAITAQTLYSATLAGAKEFAVLLALGIPRRRVSAMVLEQSFWVGAVGVALAYPACRGLGYLAHRAGADVDLRWEVLAGTAAVTVGMALASGLLALRGVRRIEPMSLLR
ncbi:MAG: FtsX-like permease family protein [Gemmataceae bacterium]|nr:FtsX-like permease family protein [Gemmataceae bacterium]